MGKLLVAALLAGSVVLGVLAYGRYRGAERAIQAAIGQARAEGRARDVEGCVSWVLGWNRTCPAMRPVCDEWVKPLLGTCLAVEDRAAYCASEGRVLQDTHNTYERCRARGLSRRDHPCAEAYLAVAEFCRGAAERRP